MKFIVMLLVLIAGLLGAIAQATGPAAQNELIVKANAELSARNWPEAESLLTSPDQWEYQKGLA